jgi:hypothetical protein
LKSVSSPRNEHTDQLIQYVQESFQIQKDNLVKDHEIAEIAMWVRQDDEMRRMKKKWKYVSLRVLETEDSMARPLESVKELELSLSQVTYGREESLCPECPVCLDSMKPPARIVQCEAGHLLCVQCFGRMVTRMPR